MPTPQVTPQYIVDNAGRPKQVVLSMRDYRRLLAALENAIDARDFRKAKQSAKAYVALADLKSALGREKKR